MLQEINTFPEPVSTPPLLKFSFSCNFTSTKRQYTNEKSSLYAHNLPSYLCTTFTANFANPLFLVALEKCDKEWQFENGNIADIQFKLKNTEQANQNSCIEAKIKFDKPSQKHPLRFVVVAVPNDKSGSVDQMSQQVYEQFKTYIVHGPQFIVYNGRQTAQQALQRYNKSQSSRKVTRAFLA